MGAACAHGACFSGLLQGASPRRKRSGTWEPSPNAPVTLASMWASPGPQPIHKDKVASEEIEFWNASLDSDCKRRPSTEPVFMGQGVRRSKFEMEQLLISPGSLPNSATMEPKATATTELLAKVPRSILEAATEEGQTLRRKLVRGATIVFISAGYPGKRFIFERAAALGVKSVIIDHPDSWSRGLVEEGIIAKFLPVDMSQSSDGVFYQAERHLHDLDKDGVTGAADGITTFVELSVPLTSRLCEAFGLPGLGSLAVDAARDKHATRAALKAAGLPTPRNCLIHQVSELEAASNHVGFPAVLKPVSGAASLGVKKVASMQELLDGYREVAAELSSLVVSSGALVKADAADGGVKAGDVVDLTVLLEQYLDGCEVDVDIVMSDGDWQYAAVSDNGPTQEPYFNETWGLCPSLLPKAQQHDLKDLAIKSVKALGFSMGVFHVELKYTSTGPQLIEVNARMGGGPVRECNRKVWGVDLVEEALFCSIGVPARPPLPSVPHTCVSYSFVNCKKSGTVKSVKCFEDLRNRDGVLSSDPLVQPGAQVVGPEEGLPTWLCLLVVSQPTSKQALDYAMDLEKELLLQIA